MMYRVFIEYMVESECEKDAAQIATETLNKAIDGKPLNRFYFSVVAIPEIVLTNKGPLSIGTKPLDPSLKTLHGY
jgi:hypothetical protein